MEEEAEEAEEAGGLHVCIFLFLCHKGQKSETTVGFFYSFSLSKKAASLSRRQRTEEKNTRRDAAGVT